MSDDTESVLINFTKELEKVRKAAYDKGFEAGKKEMVNRDRSKEKAKLRREIEKQQEKDRSAERLLLDQVYGQLTNAAELLGEHKLVVDDFRRNAYYDEYGRAR